jgi:hypothetical protein
MKKINVCVNVYEADKQIKKKYFNPMDFKEFYYYPGFESSLCHTNQEIAKS